MIFTPIGTRPEAIRLFHIVKLLRPYTLWTGQNFSKNLSTDILEDSRFENVYSHIRHNSTGEATDFVPQFSSMLHAVDKHLRKSNAHKMLVLGDTNSALASCLVAKKQGIPIYHMEAGNRCHNPESPEEVNRKMIDSIADVHLCYTDFAKQNLLDEGIASNTIHVIGNPMAEFAELHEQNTEKDHVLVTVHRQENKQHLSKIKILLENIQKAGWKVKLVLHPRYLADFEGRGFDVSPSVNFSNFIRLQKSSVAVFTDSGTVCEEAAILGKPCIILRDTMERPELLELGNTVLADMKNPFFALDAFNYLIRHSTVTELPKWYKYQQVSRKVGSILKGSPNVR